MIAVPARPHPFAFDPARTALLVIDLQNDFLHPDGFCCSMPGVDPATVARVRGIIPAVCRTIEWARHLGMAIVYTRESHRPDLSDVTPSKRVRYENAGYPIGAQGKMGRYLVRGETGCALIDEIAPRDGELEIDKPGQSAFYATDLERTLRGLEVESVLFTGVTTECCVLATYRQAADMGFFTLLLEDCCTAFDPREHEAAIDVLLGENGAVGWVGRSTDLFQAARS